MLIYLIKRLVNIFVLLVGITAISFSVIHLAPGSPVELQTSLNPKITKEVRERLIKLYGLDKPLYVQYFNWLKKVVKLDFGRSFAPDRKKVITKIKERIGITLVINVISIALIFAVAIPIGVVCAVNEDNWVDKILTVFVYIGYAMPSFWFALLLMMLFSIQLGWLPVSGIKSLNHESLSTLGKIWDYAKHLILPIGVSTFGGIAGLSRYVRNNMVEVLKTDYILSARGRGIPERKIYFRHALKNVMLPVITIVGLSIPGLIGGSVIFESIFGIPGMGQLFYQSVMARDYPVIMGILTIGSFLTLIGNLIADICYSIADPRIKIGND